MTSKTLVLLQNFYTKKYVEKINEIGISWCVDWRDAKDFGKMFFVKRMFLRWNLSRKRGLKLSWKKILIFENVRGLV